MRLLGRLRRAVSAEGPVLVKLGVYTLGCLLVLGWLVSEVGNVDWFADRTEYRAELHDVTGLVVNDEVKVAGVVVGKVTAIEIDRGRAVVTFEVDDDVALRSGTQVGVRWRNVLGQKYLYLYPSDEGDALEPGATLPLDRAVDAADVGELLNALGPVLQSIDPADANAFVQAVNEGLQGNEARVRSLLGDTATVADTLGGLDGEVGRIVTNLDRVVGALAERDVAVDATLRNLASLSGDLAARNDSLQSVVGDLAEVSEQVNRLLAENRGDLDVTIDDLEVIAATLAANRDALAETLDTLPAGVAPYHLISAYGQWFQVRATIACLANQATCAKEDPFRGSSVPVAGTDARSPGLASIVGFANSGGSSPTAGLAPSPATGGDALPPVVPTAGATP
ncbi:MAG: MCE family protein [Acidimicrobiales bacterium]|nr:MCE family protein [Acidimicrobiales bacterium]MCB1017946.1 MCE family protein [Acidimicrobiales bacterium]